MIIKSVILYPELVSPLHLDMQLLFIKKKKKKKKIAGEFPLWLSRLRTQHNVCEDAGSIPGLTHPWLRIQHCHKLQCRLQI